MTAVTHLRPRLPQLLGLLLIPPVAAWFVQQLGRMAGAAISLWQLWLLAFAIGAAFVATTLLRSADARLPRLGRPAPPAPQGRPFEQAVKWEDRLSWSEADAERFETTVRKRLIPLVAERLRLGHRVDWYSEPERVRALVPEPLLTLLSRPAVAPPNRSEMDHIVRQIETL